MAEKTKIKKSKKKNIPAVKEGLTQNLLGIVLGQSVFCLQPQMPPVVVVGTPATNHRVFGTKSKVSSNRRALARECLCATLKGCRLQMAQILTEYFFLIHCPHLQCNFSVGVHLVLDADRLKGFSTSSIHSIYLLQ